MCSHNSAVMAAVSSILLFGAIWCSQVWCAQVIPERAGVVSYNKKYVENPRFFVRRYSRRGNYYLNLDRIIKREWNNDVTVNIVFYEFLHNKYKRSFVEMHFRMCDLINKDPYKQSKALANAGMPCPLPPGKVVIHNITIPFDDFPNVWPFERCRVDVQYQLTSNEELIGEIEAYIFFKDRDVITKYTKKSKGLN